MTNNELQYARARRVLPGGVNSSTRLNQAMGFPFYASHAQGAYVWDLDGRKYIDMCCAHGAAFLGHAHPSINKAVQEAVKLGYCSMFETEHHETLARNVCNAIPCADRVRFCSSGSEATLHLIRACRAFTGRKKIIRIEGHFHGYHELIYIGGHPPRESFPENRHHPYIESAGIPKEFSDMIIPIPYNDTEALEQVIDKHGDETALLILEPVNYNCACILPQRGYLELLRERTKQAGIVLFFDEVQSSFKKSYGGAQQDFGVVPDVCTIGKSLGGGFPLSAFCGKAEIMDMYKPVGPVQHSGTFNAHLVPVLAGNAFLNEVGKATFYPQLQALEQRFHDGLDTIVTQYGLNLIVPRHGARFNMLLGRNTPAVRYEDTFCHRNELALKIYRSCWEAGVYFHDYGGGPVHHGYSIQHSSDDIDTVLQVLEEAFKKHLDDLRQ